jgi:prepilin-type N-terminal cleavage/methylation domain-containing protein/prepilin-type processing-associated H-X9-DG protein
MKGESKHAFTLTEMMVVIPVAALLTTMLFAVSNDAKQQLQAAACVNNMRQWGLGFMLYANDWNDYFPYDGQPGNVCTTINTNAWFNLVPQYIGQKRLCDLYTAGTPPTVFTKSVWSCPSSTNTIAQRTLANPCFMYALNASWHEQGSTRVGFRRNRATSPTNTILFCEEPEDNFPETNGQYDTVTRHFGGSNFVFADGHADWVHFTNFCRSGNTVGCPAPLGQLPWDESGIQGDWKPLVKYHWWPFVNAGNSSE